MRLRSLLPALWLAFGLGALVVAPTPAAESADAKKVDKLIEDLGSSDFEVREKATKRLEEIGEPALGALRKAAAGKDVEVRKRAGSLVSKLEKRVEAAKILTPTMVHLKFKDAPLKEALEDFRKKSGYNLVLHDPENKLKDRKVTLDTGKVPFWDALDQFCKKAGVVEYDPSTAVIAPPPRGFPGPGGPPGAPGGAAPGKPGVAPPAKPLPAEKVPPKPAKDVAAAAKRVGALAEDKPADTPVEDKPAKGGGAKAGAGVARPGVIAKPLPLPVPPGGGPGGGPGGMPMPGWVPTAPGQITLVDGKYKERPADTRTSVRVRAASDSKVYGTAPEGTILLPVQISPEPKLQWQRLVSVRVEKAVDDRGQKLTQTTPGAGGFGGGAGSGPAGVGVARPGGGGIAIGRPVWMPYNPMVQTTPVYLKKGEKLSKKLKVLEGVISAEVLTAAEQLIVAENILKAEDKTFKGKDGGRFKVLKVEKAAGGEITITFEMEQPTGAIPDNTGVPMMPPGGMRPGIGGPPIKAPPPLPPVKGGGAGGGAAPAGKPAVPPAGGGAAGKGGAGAGVAVVGKAVAVKGGVAIAVPAVPAGGAGGAMMMPAYGWNFGVTLRDEKGNILPAYVGMNFKPGGGIPREYVLRYTPQKEHGKPAKLVFSGRRSVPVNIPFTLKDVTLP